MMSILVEWEAYLCILRSSDLLVNACLYSVSRFRRRVLVCICSQGEVSLGKGWTPGRGWRSGWMWLETVWQVWCSYVKVVVVIVNSKEI